MDDAELLRQFVETRSEPAFRALVDRFLPLVFGVARRRLGDVESARDVSQQVFALLARKARDLRDGAALPAWLHAVAVNESRHYARREAIRRRHLDAYAQAMKSDSAMPPADSWGHLLPHLDDAMGALGESDRESLVLRFFHGCSFPEMAARAGATEEACRKRVNRAVEKLSLILRRRGVVVPAASLTAALAAESAQAVPTGVAAAVTTGALGTASSLSPLTIFTHTAAAMSFTHLTLAAAAIAFVLPIAVGWQAPGSGAVAPRTVSAPAPPAAPPASVKPPREMPVPRDPRLAEIAAGISRLGPYETDAEEWLELSRRLLRLPAELIAEGWELLRAAGSGHGPLVQSLFARWGEIDPERAADAVAAAAGDSSLESQAWLGLLSTWMLRDPSAALARVQKLPEGLMREATTLSALEKLALARPADALALLDTVPDQRIAEYSRKTTLAMWAERDPQAALDWIDAHGSDENRHIGRKKLYDDLSIERPDLTLQVALEEPEPAIREGAALFALQQLSGSDWRRALDAMAALPDDLRTRHVATNIGSILAQSAPAPAVREFIAQAPPGEFRDELARCWINQHGSGQPATAVELTADFSDPKSRDSMLDFTLGLWRKRDPQAAEAWVRDTPLLDEASRAKFLRP